MAAQSRRYEGRSLREAVQAIRSRDSRPERLPALLRRLAEADDRRRLAEPGSSARLAAEAEIDVLIRAILDQPNQERRVHRRA